MRLAGLAAPLHGAADGATLVLLADQLGVVVGGHAVQVLPVLHAALGLITESALALLRAELGVVT